MSFFKRSFFLIGGKGGRDHNPIEGSPASLGSFTAAGAGAKYNLPSGRATITFESDASHTNTTTMSVWVSNDGVGFYNIATRDVSGASAVSQPYILDAPYAYIWLKCDLHGDSVNTVTGTINI